MVTERQKSIMQNNRVLIVEDDHEIAEMLACTLAEAGLDVRIAADSAEMAVEMRRAPIGLFILDLMLPGEDGLSICRKLRAESTVPILFLTAVDGEMDRIVGLEIGADDYVTKPFSPREVLARVRSLLRRASYGPGSISTRALRFDGWRVDPLRRLVHDPNHTRIPMTSAEFDLLLAFCNNSGRVLSREELLSMTHTGLAGPIARSIDVHISRLRQKIEADPREPKMLITVRLGGYVFTPRVE